MNDFETLKKMFERAKLPFECQELEDGQSIELETLAGIVYFDFDDEGDLVQVWPNSEDECGYDY